MHKNKDDQSTSGQIDKNSEKGQESGNTHPPIYYWRVTSFGMLIFAETKFLIIIFLLYTEAETKTAQAKVQLFTNSSKSSSSVQQKNDVSEENCKSDVIEHTFNQSNCKSERTVGYR